MSHLDYLIRQDVEHGTFSPRNIFNAEYLTPQFYTYAKQLEEQIEKLRCCGSCRNRGLNKDRISEPCYKCKRWVKGEKEDKWEPVE